MDHNNPIELPPYQNHLGWQYMPEEDFDREFPENPKYDKLRKKKEQKN
jgi:hypothetical protein